MDRQDVALHPEASACRIFGDALGDPVADRLLEAIREAGADGLDGTTQRNLFARHVSADRLAAARSELERRGLVVTSQEGTEGRARSWLG